MTALLSCAQKNTGSSAIPLPEKTTPSKNEAVAVFAEGCFWHTEIVFQSLTGVRDAISDYAGGKTKNPDYKSIGSGQTGPRRNGAGILRSGEDQLPNARGCFFCQPRSNATKHARP